jgi:hypothetical protein
MYPYLLYYCFCIKAVLLLDATLLSFYAYAVHIGSGSVLPVIVGYIFATFVAVFLFT